MRSNIRRSETLVGWQEKRENTTGGKGRCLGHRGCSKRRENTKIYPLANIVLMPRSACRVRSSFSISEKRTWLSP